MAIHTSAQVADLLTSQRPGSHVIELEDLGDGFWSAAVADDAAQTMAPGVVTSYFITPDQRLLMLPAGFPDNARLRLKGLVQELGDDVETGFLLQEALQSR